MPPRKMHANEVEVDVALVRALIGDQFPQWADLPIAPVASAGTDNAHFRLGAGLLVRMPRIHWAVDDVPREQEWLPRLAPHLPLAIPAPLASGRPGAGYPWHWSIYRWIPGSNARHDNIRNLSQFVDDLAGLLRALQGIDTPGAPRAARGEHLAARDAPTRSAIAQLDGLIDTSGALRAWEAARAAPAWDQPPVWIHGDLKPDNLLVRAGRLAAVIDFGGVGRGDPAVDLQIAWNFLPGEVRPALRNALGVDVATWARGKGWALSVGLIALPYYKDTNPRLASMSRHAINQVIADHLAGG